MTPAAQGGIREMHFFRRGAVARHLQTVAAVTLLGGSGLHHSDRHRDGSLVALLRTGPSHCVRVVKLGATETERTNSFSAPGEHPRQPPRVRLQVPRTGRRPRHPRFKPRKPHRPGRGDWAQYNGVSLQSPFFFWRCPHRLQPCRGSPRGVFDFLSVSLSSF